MTAMRDDRRHHGPRGRAEYRLPDTSARAVVDSTPPAPPRPGAFLSTEHLSTEAVAAYVDDRLPPGGTHRAAEHLSVCTECAREVEAQRDARRALRGSGPIRMPEDLRERLSRLACEPDASAHDAPAAREPGPLARWVRRILGRDR